jgi:transporter family protein
MDMYIILALIAMALFGVNAIVYKIAPNIDAVTLTLVSFTVSAVGTLFYWIFFVSKKQISLGGVGVGVIGGLVSVAALICFIMALQLGKASVVNTLRALSAGVTVILAVVFLSEKLTMMKAAGVVLAIIAAVLLSL